MAKFDSHGSGGSSGPVLAKFDSHGSGGSSRPVFAKFDSHGSGGSSGPVFALAQFTADGPAAVIEIILHWQMFHANAAVNKVNVAKRTK